MNKYEIIGIVGEGAYGIVYKAKNKETGDVGNELSISMNVWRYSGDKKVQRVGWRWNSEENHFQGGQNAPNAQVREHRTAQRGLQKVRSLGM